MITVFYLVVFITSVVMNGYYMIRNRKIDSIFAVFGVAVTINAMGRYMLATATNTEMALFATKAMYLGGSYAPFIFLVTLSKLCNVKVSRVVKGTMVIYSTLIFGFVLTIEKHKLYYKNIKLVVGKGYNYLIKDYGPFHKLYAIMLAMYGVLIIYYLLCAIKIKNKTNVSNKAVLLMCVLVFVIFSTYLLERLIGTNISYLSAGYLVSVIFMGRFFDRVNMYDRTANVMYSIERMKSYGYIAFDKKDRYIGANTYIKEIFPEITEWQIDAKVEETDSYLQEEVLDFVLCLKTKNNAKKTIEINNKFYELNCRDIYYKKNYSAGYVLEFIDRTAQKKYIQNMKSYNELLEQEVREKTTDLIYLKDKLILGVADLLESRDRITGGHIKRTTDVIKIFSAKLLENKDKFGISSNFLNGIVKAAPMHDLGKITIDDKILRKNGEFTEEEFNEMKQHTTEGARIVKQIFKNVEDDDFYRLTENIAHYHHEKWNGKGYPCGLVGNEIPFEARIMTLADTFDELVTKRGNKEGVSYDKAFEIIEELLGEHFDPELGTLFIECRPELEMLYDNYRKQGN